jgi:hypothetical protein
MTYLIDFGANENAAQVPLGQFPSREATPLALTVICLAFTEFRTGSGCYWKVGSIACVFIDSADKNAI